MAGGWQTQGLNNAVDGIASKIATLCLHTANPNGTGASEVSGGDYAPAAVTMPAAANAQSKKTLSAISIPAQTSISYWSAKNSAGQVLVDGPLLDANTGAAVVENFSGSAGTYTPTITITSTGVTVGT